jgi:hypothetical protein
MRRISCVVAFGIALSAGSSVVLADSESEHQEKLRKLDDVVIIPKVRNDGIMRSQPTDVPSQVPKGSPPAKSAGSRPPPPAASVSTH